MDNPSSLFNKNWNGSFDELYAKRKPMMVEEMTPEEELKFASECISIIQLYAQQRAVKVRPEIFQVIAKITE
ncbi:MAG: hypothetical protein ACK5MF_09360 [Vibrio sp.]|uniref:hypothetical protein n=1 Tax=Vibrio sp. TaxID=678 RepID=UPI003A844283